MRLFQQACKQAHRRQSFGLRSYSVPTLPAVAVREPHERDPKIAITVELMDDKPGGLAHVLALFEQYKTNVSHIESKLKSYTTQGPMFLIDFEGKEGMPQVDKLLGEMGKLGLVRKRQPRLVPWFPVNIRELDLTKETLGSMGGDDGEGVGDGLINEDHPGFTDKEYMARRQELARLADSYSFGQPLPHIEYNDNETRTWGAVYAKLRDLSGQYACEEYLHNLDRMEKYCGYGTERVPQINDISNFLQQETGFQLRPVQGLLSARDFLNALAFRVFFSTQYIRHHGNPFYTPEPDICHELMGHAPMFADRNFADFSHQIGLASLAASDADIDRLASCYWFTVEFGLVQEGDAIKCFGAGLLSSFGEMEWSCADDPSAEVRDMGGMTANHPHLLKPEIRPFEPEDACDAVSNYHVPACVLLRREHGQYEGENGALCR